MRLVTQKKLKILDKFICKASIIKTKHVKIASSLSIRGSPKATRSLTKFNFAF